MPQNLLMLLLMLHLSGLMRSQGAQARPNKAQRPRQPQPSMQRPGGAPAAQGAHGMAQGFHGMMAPSTGGVGSLKNQAGLYPHQQNPLLLLSGMR